jgi:hypothetical protein
MNNEQLTAAEMGKLWASYMGNTMGKCVLSYYLKHVEDQEINKVLEYALDLCESFSQQIKTILTDADFPTPVGFGKEDVNLDAPRLFSDEFYLSYLMYTGKAGMSIYNVAIPLVTRKDVRDFFISCLQETVKLMSAVTYLALQKNIIMNAPVIPAPQGVDFVTKQNFLTGFLRDRRPLHGLEIAHLYGNINNDITSKALIIGFAQGAKNEKIRRYFERGEILNQKHIEMMSQKLSEDNLPSPSLQDHLVTSSTISPFSDKLMIQHKIDMFSMKIREYAGGASLNGRIDVGTMYVKMQVDVSLFIEDGANIMIDHGWMEQPPQTIDREELLQIPNR